ncbi:hypothetical protein D3C75_1081660 [compost metagenome]
MRLSPAYSSWVGCAAFSILPSARSPDQPSWAMAVILPSALAPMRMRWMVAGLWVVLLIICGRASATFTGRAAMRAPRAASTASDLTNSLPPKPPPM